MDATANLRLPYILPSQAQKHVTHNEAIRALDALVQLSVLDRDRAVPPEAPGDGDRHIVAEGATGAWAGHAGSVAAWQDGAWAFLAPRPGWLAWVVAEDALLVHDGETWRPAAAAASGAVETLGVNATADPVNRLAVKAQASLFDEEGGDHRLKINRADADATASLIFQTNYSARAELGLAGDDIWRLKTSGDGALWHEAMRAEAATGRVSFPAGIVHAPTGKALKGLIFTPGGDGEISIYRNDAPRAQNPRQAVLASVAGDLLTFTTSAAALFFHVYMRDVSLVRIWNVSKTPEQPAWVKWNTALNQIQVTAPAAVAGWLAGETIQIGDPLAITPIRSIAIDISPMMQRVLGAAFPQDGIVLKAGIAGTAAVGLNVSPTGTSGSFVGAISGPTGQLNNETMIVPSSLPSPVSPSNLLFLREDGDGSTGLGLSLLSVVGLFA